MIELFKIIQERMIRHVFLISISLNYQTTPLGLGETYKLTQYQCHYDLRKYTNCVIPICGTRLSDYRRSLCRNS